MIRLLQYHENPNIQLEAAWALTNIASGTTSHISFLIKTISLFFLIELYTFMLVQAGCQKEFIKLLSHPNRSIQKQALWGLSNIQGDYSSYTKLFRKEFIENQGIQKLIQFLSDVVDSFSLLIASRKRWIKTSYNWLVCVQPISVKAKKKIQKFMLLFLMQLF